MKKQQLIALLIGAVINSSSMIMAQDHAINMETDVNLEVDATQINEMKNEYISKIGKITEINKGEECYRLLVGTPLDGVQYILDNSEIIIDAETLNFLQPSDLKEGMELTVVAPKNAPMTLSLPPMMSDQTVIIVNSSEVSLDMSYFDEMLVNEENTLALNITKDTYITNTKGEKRIFTADDIKNNSAIVIYTASTRSIPAQTTPKMVMILPSMDSEENLNEEVMPSIKKEVEETEYLSIREIAIEYGYNITWDNEIKSATLEKDDHTVVLTVGEAQCIHDGKAKELNKQIKLENQKVYVSRDLKDLL